MLRSARFIGAALVLAIAACAKADESKSPPPVVSSEATGLGSDAGEVDAAGALRALPMPSSFRA